LRSRMSRASTRSISRRGSGGAATTGVASRARCRECDAKPAQPVTHGIGSLGDVGKRGAESLKCTDESVLKNLVSCH